MYLVKSCYQEDHILQRKTLKLGTLYEYRDIEDQQVADAEEGFFSFTLSLENEVEVAADWFNAISAGVVRVGGSAPPMLGRMNAKVDRIHMLRTTSDAVVLGQCSMEITRQAPNVFIYCMSAVRRVSKAEGIFPKYDSRWAITRARAATFALAIGKALRQEITVLAQKGASILPNHIQPEDIRIHCRHEVVLYVPRNLHIDSDGILSLDEFMRTIRDMSFVKPPSFSHELEYRFSYTLEHSGLVVEPACRHLFLPADEVIPLIL